MSNEVMKLFYEDGDSLNALNADTFRRGIEVTEQFMKDLPQVIAEPVHRFAEGLYCRQLTMPAGSVFVSRVHKHENYAFIMQGSCTVISENGAERLYSPFMMKTNSGTKRLLVIHEECTWITVHALPAELAESQDVDKIEEYFACDTLEEYEQGRLIL